MRINTHSAWARAGGDWRGPREGRSLMSTSVRGHIRSNIVGYIALFCFVIGGTAIGSTHLSKNSVKSKHIVNGQVKEGDLADGSVVTVKLADGSVTTGKIEDGAVTGAKVDESTLGQVPDAAH